MARAGVNEAPVGIFATPDALAAGAAAEFFRLAAASLAARGRFVVALAGGATPAALYRRVAAEAAARHLDLSRVHFAWSDERCVPPDDPASNFRMARENLLDRLPVPAGNLHRLRGEDAPDDAAADYERDLRRLFATPAGEPSLVDGRRFDLVLLGLGADGHTASLFPGDDALAERERWAVAVAAPAGGLRRVTLTLPVINAAAEVRILVAGAGKAAALRRVLEEAPDPRALPAQAIAPRAGNLRWLVDAAAAAQRDPSQGGRRK